MEPRVIRFTHRNNPDATCDSICRHCFRTVGHATSEQALVTEEVTHVCNMLDLLRIGKIRALSSHSLWADPSVYDRKQRLVSC
jgi:hypothetical protein